MGDAGDARSPVCTATSSRVRSLTAWGSAASTSFGGEADAFEMDIALRTAAAETAGNLAATPKPAQGWSSASRWGMRWRTRAVGRGARTHARRARRRGLPRVGRGRERPPRSRRVGGPWLDGGGVSGRPRQRDAGAADGRRGQPARPARGEPGLPRHRGDRRQRDDDPRRGGVRRAGDVSCATVRRMKPAPRHYPAARRSGLARKR